MLNRPARAIEADTTEAEAEAELYINTEPPSKKKQIKLYGLSRKERPLAKITSIQNCSG